MIINKKSAQTIFKSIFYKLFKIIYGNINGIISAKDNAEIEIKNIQKNNGINYKVYKIKNARLYTDRIQDTAIIKKNFLIREPSFQYRNINSEVIKVDAEDNIIFLKGTPRILKKTKGKVLSLLTGGGGNKNYWHWIFDVLPRLHLCEKMIDLNDIDYFLLPDNDENFQKETLKILKIPEKKQISSRNFRHISSDEIFVTDHPSVLINNATLGNQNMPSWISNWLKEKFININKDDNKQLYKKVYIDRGDSKSNVAHLRSIINEEEIREFLVNKGFNLIKLAEMRFEEQVKAFSNADIVIGLHGAGFANLVFCKTGTKVIELKNINSGKVIENLAKTNHLNYSYIDGDQIGSKLKNQQGHIFISTKDLENRL
tara:strand:+ start:51 stop:1166 length:1116 start_codon:yes stop_codon:yes gene_type:complete